MHPQLLTSRSTGTCSTVDRTPCYRYPLLNQQHCSATPVPSLPIKYGHCTCCLIQRDSYACFEFQLTRQATISHIRILLTIPVLFQQIEYRHTTLTQGNLIDPHRAILLPLVPQTAPAPAPAPFAYKLGETKQQSLSSHHPTNQSTSTSVYRSSIN